MRSYNPAPNDRVKPDPPPAPPDMWEERRAEREAHCLANVRRVDGLAAEVERLKAELTECRRERDHWRESVKLRWALHDRIARLLGVDGIEDTQEQLETAIREIESLKERDRDEA